MPAKYVRPYSKGQKNDFRDAEVIAEAVRRQTMKFVATKTANQLELQALHRARERLVSQRTGARAGTDRSCGKSTAATSASIAGTVVTVNVPQPAGHARYGKHE